MIDDFISAFLYILPLIFKPERAFYNDTPCFSKLTQALFQVFNAGNFKTDCFFDDLFIAK